MSKKDTLFVSMMPLLRQKSGHDYVYHHCVKRIIEENGYSYLGFISKESTLTDTPPTWKKWFALAEKPLGYWRRFLRRYRDFSGILRTKLTSKSRIFFLESSFTRLDLLALSIAIIIHKKPNDYFWILYRFPLPEDKNNLYRKLNRLLYWHLKDRLVFLTDSEKVGTTFNDELFSPYVLPIPHTRIVPKSSGGQKIKCWWPGPPREHKGWADIQRLSKVQTKEARNFVLIAASSSGLLTNNTTLKIDLIPDALNDDEYVNYLAQCDIVLLPYDPVAYFANTSGIFVEAVVAHKIPLVKEGSWLADELKKFQLHELIVDWERKDFFDHISTLIRDENMLKKLCEMQKSYAEFHNLKTFQNKFVALFEKGH